MSGKNKPAVLVLTKGGREVTDLGAHMIRSALHLPADTGIGFGAFLNDPHFLAGAIVQSKIYAETYVAAIDEEKGKLNALHSEHDLSLLVRILMKEGAGRSSFEIFMEHF